MAAIVSFAHLVGTRLLVWLVGRHGIPMVLAGTLSLATIGAAAANVPPTPTSTPAATVQPGTPTSTDYSGPHYCDHDGDGGSYASNWQ
jgi:hypothetical protein